MRLYAGYTVDMILKMPAKTFFALLGEGSKLAIYEIKKQLSITAYPHMDEDSREQYLQTLMLPDDILSDMIEAETSETEKAAFKQALEE